MTPRRWLLAAAAIAIAVVLLGYSLHGVDYAEVGDILARTRFAPMAPLLVALAAVFWLRATRWARILKPVQRFTVRQVLPALLIGFAGNNLLPARLGELLRAAVFAREFRLPFSAVVTSLFLERLLDMAAVLMLYVLALAFSEERADTLSMTVWPAALACAGVLGVVWAMLEAPGRVPGWWLALSAPLPERIRSAGEQALKDAIHALGSVRSPRAVALMLVNSLSQWALAAAMIWLSLAALGQSIPPAVAIITVTATVFAAMLPSAPGYVGAMQAAFVVTLTPFGVSREMALASSAIYTVAQWIPVTALGLWMLLAPAPPEGRPRWMMVSDALRRPQLDNA